MEKKIKRLRAGREYIWKAEIVVHITHNWKPLSSKERYELKKAMKKTLDKFMEKRGLF